MSFLRVILASASPRRQQLLKSLGLKFETVATGIDESAIQAGDPRSLVMKIAAAKVDAATRMISSDGPLALIIGADTEVVLDGKIFGKPADRRDADVMLRRLSGRTHEVFSGLALKLFPAGALWLNAGRSEVTFRSLTDSTISDYVNSGECDDKAGAYGLQGRGGELIERVRGDLGNVIGLPLEIFRAGWREMTGEDPLRGRDPMETLREAFPDLKLKAI